jgi:hypothetical protein
MMPRQQQFRRIDMPQTPTAGEMVHTLEHVTGRPADLREVAALQRQLDAAQNDYAPGGEQSLRSRVILR